MRVLFLTPCYREKPSQGESHSQTDHLTRMKSADKHLGVMEDKLYLSHCSSDSSKEPEALPQHWPTISSPAQKQQPHYRPGGVGEVKYQSNKSELLPLIFNTKSSRKPLVSFTVLAILYIKSVHFFRMLNRAGTACFGHHAKHTFSTAVVTPMLKSAGISCIAAMLICFLLPPFNCCQRVFFYFRQVKGPNFFYFEVF